MTESCLSRMHALSVAQQILHLCRVTSNASRRSGLLLKVRQQYVFKRSIMFEAGICSRADQQPLCSAYGITGQCWSNHTA